MFYKIICIFCFVMFQNALAMEILPVPLETQICKSYNTLEQVIVPTKASCTSMVEAGCAAWAPSSDEAIIYFKITDKKIDRICSKYGLETQSVYKRTDADKMFIVSSPVFAFYFYNGNRGNITNIDVDKSNHVFVPVCTYWAPVCEIMDENTQICSKYSTTPVCKTSEQREYIKTPIVIQEIFLGMARATEYASAGCPKICFNSHCNQVERWSYYNGCIGQSTSMGCSPYSSMPCAFRLLTCQEGVSPSCLGIMDKYLTKFRFGEIDEGRFQRPE